MSEEKYKLSRLITYLYETMNGELARDYAELDGENIELLLKEFEEKDKEIERLNNIIDRTTKYVQSLSSKGRGCDIYEDIKQEILKELKGEDKK